MFAIPFQISETEFSVFVALQKDNLDRIKEYDPAELTLNKFGPPFDTMRLKDVIIGFANNDDFAKTTAMIREGKPLEALRHLSRGWKFRPDRGDDDFPYLSLEKVQ